MALYFCFTPHGALQGPLKTGLAKEITRLHVEATGTPAALIHVVFQELPVGAHYLGGKCDHASSIIIANFRGGGPGEVGPKLMKSISAAWSRMTRQPEQNVVMSLSEADCAAIAGLALPQMGEEAAWCNENQSALPPLGRKT
jgi:phenylpyruvate tautomerase PptA (4-oxalocrotonate tautomerase family)